MSKRALIGAAVALVVLPGCGQSAEERFRVQELRPLAREIEREQTQFAAVIQVARPGKRRDMRAVRAAVGDIATVSKRIAALRPPESAREEFARYAAANGRLVQTLRDFSAAMRAPAGARLAPAGERAQAAAGAVSRAQRSLEAALTG